MLSGRLGWRTPVWLETTAEDPGRSQTRAALDGGAAAVPKGRGETILVVEDQPAMLTVATRLLERNGLTAADIDLFVSHQANRRIIQAATEKLGVDPSKVIINIERFGNTTAATIPLALNDAITSGRLKKGQLVLIATVGAGFTVGALLLRWGF